MSNLGYLQIQEFNCEQHQMESTQIKCFTGPILNENEHYEITTVTHQESLIKTENSQDETHVDIKNELAIYSENAIEEICFHDDEIGGIEIIPLTIPHIFIRSSPFQSTTPIIQNGQTLPTKQEENPKIIHLLWAQIIYCPKFFCLIMDLLDCEDCLSLSEVNPRLESMFYLYKLFRLNNCWNFTMHQISRRGKQQTLEEILNESILNQSEHSLDLERLSSLFLPDENPGEQLGRVDRVMKALNWAGVEYFQGLNSIVVVLVSLFDDETSYWTAILLLEKSEHISNCPISYQQNLMRIEKEIKEKCTKVYAKINEYDINIEYFTMKWVMSLFASDIDRLTLICFWDLLLNFGMPALLWFVVSVFKILEEDIILVKEEDELNEMLKTEFKETLNQTKALKVMQLTKVFMSHEMYGEGSEELIKPEGETYEDKFWYDKMKNLKKWRRIEEKCVINVGKYEEIDKNAIINLLEERVLEKEKTFETNKHEENIKEPKEQTIELEHQQQHINEELFTKIQQQNQENNHQKQHAESIPDFS